MSSHPAWAERIAFYETSLEGTWTIEKRNGEGSWLLDPTGRKVGAVLTDAAFALAAALNTDEGRRAFARSRTENEC